ncbi:MAG TPA: hypothetical protein VL443_27890 [Cyclobacteriaceae bacterium]|nr:hypothetical protein [Cyclobacteriaceae bacterium]
MVEWPVRQIWTLTDKQNENSIQCDGSIKDFILELDWLTTKEFCEKYNIETPSWKGSVELAASEFLNIDAIKWNMVKDFAKKQKLPIAQIKSSEITIGKFIELNGHQPFEEYDSLSNVIQHAACFWKTDMHNWTLLLEEINKLCLKLTYFTPSPEASRGNDVRGKDANIKSIDMSDVPKTPVDSYYKELGNRAITDSGVSAEEAAEKYFKSQKLAGSPFDGFIAGYKEATLKLQSVLQDKEQQINDLISLNDQITETYTNQLSDKDKEIAGLKQALQLIEEKSDYIGVKEPSFREINELASNALKEKP